MFPLWLKLALTLFVAVLVPVYTLRYGPKNFLWFSDIALFGVLAALWLESSLIASAVAVGVLVLELLWNLDFFVQLISGKNLVGLSDYMFDAKIEMWIRALSLFHVVVPILVVYIIWRLGYDERGMVLQLLIALIVLPLSRTISTREENINWVYGFGPWRRTRLSGPVYVTVLFAGLTVLIYLPTHIVLSMLF